MIRNITKKKTLAGRYLAADSLLDKALGLMFKKSGQSMLFNFYIENNLNFHTFFMRYSIDILFLNSQRKVSKIVRNVKPWRLNVKGKGKYVVEVPSGKSLNTEVGDVISFK